MGGAIASSNSALGGACPVAAFPHCEDVLVVVANAGCFAILGEVGISGP